MRFRWLVGLVGVGLLVSSCGGGNYLEEFEIAHLELESGVVDSRSSNDDGTTILGMPEAASVFITFSPADDDTPIEVLFEEAVAVAEAQGWDMTVRRGPLDPPREYPDDQPCGAGGVRPAPTKPDQLVGLGITCMRLTFTDDGDRPMNLAVALNPIPGSGSSGGDDS